MSASMTQAEVIQTTVFLGRFYKHGVFSDVGGEALEPLRPLRYTCPEHSPGTHMIIWTLKATGVDIWFFRLDVRLADTHNQALTSPAEQLIGPYLVHFIHGGGSLDIGRIEDSTKVEVNFDGGKYIVTYFKDTRVLEIKVSSVGRIYMIPG